MNPKSDERRHGGWTTRRRAPLAPSRWLDGRHFLRDPRREPLPEIGVSLRGKARSISSPVCHGCLDNLPSDGPASRPERCQLSIVAGNREHISARGSPCGRPRGGVFVIRRDKLFLYFQTCAARTFRDT